MVKARGRENIQKLLKIPGHSTQDKDSRQQWRLRNTRGSGTRVI